MKKLDLMTLLWSGLIGFSIGAVIGVIFFYPVLLISLDSCSNRENKINSDYVPRIVGHCYFAQKEVPCKDINPAFDCNDNNMTIKEAIQLCGKYLGD